MLEEAANDFAAYLKLDINQELSGVQKVVDNMLTRLEEFESVLNMIKSKNDDCKSEIFDEIQVYKSEITGLSKKIDTLEAIISKVKSNVDSLESHICKAEADLGISADNKLKNILKPFLSRNTEVGSASAVTSASMWHPQLESVLGYFQERPLCE